MEMGQFNDVSQIVGNLMSRLSSVSTMQIASFEIVLFSSHILSLSLKLPASAFCIVSIRHTLSTITHVFTFLCRPADTASNHHGSPFLRLFWFVATDLVNYVDILIHSSRAIENQFPAIAL